MPNWCEGILKVRGTKANITKWVNEALQLGYHPAPNEPDKLVQWTDDGMEAKVVHQCWIKDSYRGFVESNSEISFWRYEGCQDDEEVIVMVDAIFAWSCDAEALAKSSKKFNVDYRFYGFECGMEFNQLVEIHKGEIVKDNCYEFSDYQWECISPQLGG